MWQTGILPATNKIRKRKFHEMTMRYIWIQGQAAEMLTDLTCTKEVFCANPDRESQQF